MSELPGPSTGGSNNGGARAQGPIPQPTKMTTPTDIMRRRKEREQAKLRAEAERQATQNALIGDATPNRPVAGGAPISISQSQRQDIQSQIPASALNPQQIQQSQGRSNMISSGRRRTSTAQSAQRPFGPTTTIPSSPSQQAPSNAALNDSPQQSRLNVPPTDTGTGLSNPALGTQLPSQTGVSSFPHAFERWETLSSHWEGLTSYWLRRLDQNAEELRREPLLQQLSRQVTDLSAAGANLFHAVVELQKLRQSSERKFQRWHYETRKEAERHKEISNQLESALIAERQARATAIDQTRDLLDETRNSRGKNAKMQEEMKRELQIAKEEARRAWEELGRREQEERERTAALREGQPIVIGGIQVFPTTSHTRGEYGSVTDDTRPVTRDGSRVPPPLQGDIDTIEHQEPSPTNTDPFTEQASRQPAVALHNPPLQNPSHYPIEPYPIATNGDHDLINSSAPPGGFYDHPNSFLHSTAHSTSGIPAIATDKAPSYVTSEGAFSSELDEEDYEYNEQGHIQRDAQGNPIFQQRTNLIHSQEDLSAEEELARERQFLKNYGPNSSGIHYPPIPAPSSSLIHPPITTATTINSGSSNIHSTSPSGPVQTIPSSSSSTLTNPQAPDYEGHDYDTWNRNQFPSRLSNIAEQDEDERSRISEASGKHPRLGHY